MKKWFFDAFMFITMAGFLTAVVYYNFQDFYITFSMIPLIVFYYLGQYSQRKFGSSGKETS